MTTFKNEQYTITTSLTDHSIYIKIVNNMSYATYEGTFEETVFRLSFELPGIYRLINKCFAAFTDKNIDNKYSVVAELEPSCIRLVFHCAIEEFLELDFEIRLKEKIVSGNPAVLVELEKQKQIIEMLNETAEKQATELAEFTGLHKKYSESMKMFIDQQANMSAELTKLTDRLKMLETKDRENQAKIQTQEQLIEQLGHAEINFHYTTCCHKSPNSSLGIAINSKCVTINSKHGNCMCPYNLPDSQYEKIKHFYQLDELTLIQYSDRATINITSSQTAKKLTIESSSSLNASFIQNFPNLEELTMEGFGVDSSIVTTLRSIKHNIKKLTFKSVGGINQTEMQTYCTQNNIDLHLS